MFDKLISSFQMHKKADAPPGNSDFLRPKVEPVKKPGKMLPERKALPAAIQEKPPTILLPSVSAAPAVASVPMEALPPFVALPPDVDPNQVAIVRRDAKRTDGERFKYTDKPLKPFGADGRPPELIKYNDKKAVDGLSQPGAPLTTRMQADGAKNKNAQVFKYTPARIEIKS